MSLVTDTDHGTHGAAGAVFDESRIYRYRLWRTWDESKPRMTFIMLNPSTADAFVLDPTVRRCVGFAQREGCGTLEVVNVFALRSTDPAALKRSVDPVGPDNDDQIVAAAEGCDIRVAAWGVHAALHDRGKAVKSLLTNRGHSLHYLKLTKSGFPGHPLYVPGVQPLTRW